MNLITLADMKRRVRERADMENSEFVDDAELEGYINKSADALYDLLVTRFQDYYLEVAPLSIAAGAGSLSLPTDFYKLLGVDVNVSGQWYSLKPYEWAERNTYRNMTGIQPWEVRYHLRGDVNGNQTLRLLPTPPAPLSGEITYIPTRPQLSEDGENSANYLQGWEEWVIVDAAIKCLNKEESDASGLLEEKAGLTARIQDAAENRNPGEVQRVADVTSADTDWVGRGRWNLGY